MSQVPLENENMQAEIALCPFTKCRKWSKPESAENDWVIRVISLGLLSRLRDSGSRKFRPAPPPKILRLATIAWQPRTEDSECGWQSASIQSFVRGARIDRRELDTEGHTHGEHWACVVYCAYKLHVHVYRTIGYSRGFDMKRLISVPISEHVRLKDSVCWTSLSHAWWKRNFVTVWCCSWQHSAPISK